MRPCSRRQRTRTIALVLGVAAAMLAACGGGGSADPEELVAQAKQTLDATSGLHFTLDSSGVPSTGTALIGGEGDITRPDAFKGTLRVRVSGLSASVEVVSVGGTVYVKPPLVPTFTKADPTKYGFSDPGQLLDPSTGLTSLLADATDVSSDGRDRFNGEALDEVNVTIPGSAVERVLTSKDPAQPVHGRLGINADSHELRRAVLTGPFLDKSVMTTFTIVLDEYGKTVSISAPG